jgi:drug/metabolite transporter (DMT)-like permease
LIAGLCLLIWYLIRSKNKKIIVDKISIFSGIILGIILFAGYAFQTFGLLYTTTSKAAFITGLSVVLVPLFAYVLFKQKPQPFAILGVFVALIGLYFLTMIKNFGMQLGEILVLFCAISFALHIIFTGQYARKFDALLLTVTQIITVALCNIIAAIIFEDISLFIDPNIVFKLDVFVAILVTSLLATALAFFLQTSFQRYTTATKVGIIFAMEPVFAAITAFYFTSEYLGLSTITGCLLIFGGMILAEIPREFKFKKMKQA